MRVVFLVMILILGTIGGCDSGRGAQGAQVRSAADTVQSVRANVQAAISSFIAGKQSSVQQKQAASAGAAPVHGNRIHLREVNRVPFDPELAERERVAMGIPTPEQLKAARADEREAEEQWFAAAKMQLEK